MTTTASSTSLAPTATGKLAGMGTADALALSARMGWMPSYPTFDRNPLDLADDVEASGLVGRRLRGRPAAESGELGFACRGPGRARELAAGADHVASEPVRVQRQGQRVLPQAPAGHGVIAVRADETPEHRRPRDIVWHDEAPEGKLDLLCTLDFRMTSSTILSDIVLPAATWYEKHDISTTDMHPFIHSFNPAIAPPWQTKTDWDIFQVLAESFAPLAKEHLGVRRDLVAVPLLHDTAEAMATPHGIVKDWKKGECEPGPGHDDAQAGGRRARLWRRRREDGRTRPADGEAGCRPPRGSPTTSAERSTISAGRTERSGEGWPTAGRA